MIKLHNIDCMIAMQEAPDNYWDLAIVDPPYGMKRLGAQSGGKANMEHLAFHNGSIKKWDIPPTKKYFDLF